VSDENPVGNVAGLDCANAHQRLGAAMSTSHSVSDSAGGPLVTIAIPTFNRASWLKDCVLSALSQTYQHFEILVSDNASTDETEQVLREYNDRRLRVVRQDTNIGMLQNFNACLAGARGDYVIIVPDDDRIAPWLLERCVGLVEKGPQIPIVIALGNTHSTLVGRTWPAHASQYLETGIWDGTDILLEYLNDQLSIHICSIMMRTDAIRARGGFPLDFPHLADIAAWAPLLLKGKAGLVNEACATSYGHEANETTRLGVEQRLRDGWQVADLISNMAEHSISDWQQRRKIQLQSRRHFARRGLTVLYVYRKGGGRLVRVLTTVWHFRRDWSHIDMESLRRLRWQIAFILCGRQLAWIRRLKRNFIRVSGHQACDG
jgi:glycosyltransferase involved in cell wall biosynthesis